MRAYFREAIEMSKRGYGDIDYLFLGFQIFMSPVAAPLYYLGRFAVWIDNLGDE